MKIHKNPKKFRKRYRKDGKRYGERQIIHLAAFFLSFKSQALAAGAFFLSFKRQTPAAGAFFLSFKRQIPAAGAFLIPPNGVLGRAAAARPRRTRGGRNAALEAGLLDAERRQRRAATDRYAAAGARRQRRAGGAGQATVATGGSICFMMFCNSVCWFLYLPFVILL